MPLKMIDVSSHQGDVRWGKAKEAGIALAGVKATEGQDFVDPLFTKERVQALHRQHLPFTPYHYLRFRRDRSGAVEADHCLDVIRDRGWTVGRDLPVTVDTEWIGNETELRAMSGGAAREYVREFAARIQQKTRRGCIDYLSPSFAPELGNLPARHAGASWVAAWDAPDGRPPTPRGFRQALVVMHQTSDAFHAPYVGSGVCDFNLFLGGHGALLALIQGHKLPTPDPAPRPSNPDKLTVRQIQSALRQLGWPINVDGVRGAQTIGAVMDFQRGFVGTGVHLTRDGVVGARTAKAIKWSLAHDGRLSPNFHWVEFRSKHESCHGNDWIKTHRALVIGLEKYRRKVRHGVQVVSGFRDPAKNACEGGASQSMHMFANAADLLPELTVNEVRALGVFSGIGFQGATGKVRHVDVRHKGPNFTGGTVSDPTIWRYS